MTKAQLYHSIATDLDCDPELVGVVATEKKLRKRDEIEAAVRARLSGADGTTGIDDTVQGGSGATDESEPEAPKTKKPPKPGLTLSQRRALLRLLDADTDGVRPATGFKALPYVYVEEVGYAVSIDEEVEDGEVVRAYLLTDAGRERAESINPKYRDWSAGETVVGDESRPPAGTYRAQREAEAAAKATAEAEAAKQVEDAPEPDAETVDVEPEAPELVAA